MEAPTSKGTVTSLSSIFPVEDSQKAAKRVENALAEKQQELDRVREFIADNSTLVNLVQKLPEELHHDIMVPFGKAAFFPGRLIHTNEFMVLLGEGYYTERTSKQTVEILKRRGKVLDSQIDSLKAMMKDLQAEALFFGTTASEAAEGLVEIREELVDENLSERESGSGLLQQDASQLSEADNTHEDEEYARVMSRLDELEEEELCAEIENRTDNTKQNNPDESDSGSKDEVEDEDEDDDEEFTRIMSRFDELEEQELAAETKNGSAENKNDTAAESDSEMNEDEQPNTVFRQFSNQITLDHNLKLSELKQDMELSKPPQQMKKKVTFKDLTVQSSMGSTENAIHVDAKPHANSLATSIKAHSAEKASLLPEEEIVATLPSLTRKEISAKTSKPAFDIDKAIGSIVEHDYNIQTNLPAKDGNTLKPASFQPSKPVSRFKMQRK